MYGINYQIFESWTRCITDLRNKCAHFTRLYYWTFTAIPKMPAEVKYVPNRRLFAQLMMLKLMYPDHERWNRDFVRPLIKLVKDFKPYISYSHIGFPYQWKSMLKYWKRWAPGQLQAGLRMEKPYLEPLHEKPSSVYSLCASPWYSDMMISAGILPHGETWHVFWFVISFW